MWPLKRRTQPRESPPDSASEPVPEPAPEPAFELARGQLTPLQARALDALEEHERKKLEAELEYKARGQAEAIKAFEELLLSQLGIEASPDRRYATIEGVPLCLTGGLMKCMNL